MAQPPDEKSYVEIPFVEQLKGMEWQHLEGDIDVPYLTERESFRDVLLTKRAVQVTNVPEIECTWIENLPMPLFFKEG